MTMCRDPERQKGTKIKTLTKRYAGIGSRQTPKEVLDLMESFAKHAAFNYYFLHSGGASGADEAFYKGAKAGEREHPTMLSASSGCRKSLLMSIFLPFDGFNGNWVSKSPECTRQIPHRAFEIAEKFYHSDLKSKSETVQKLMARNVLQVLGPDVDTPVDFIVCYTPDGKASGGTGQALRIAEAYNIPAYNLYHSIDVFEIERMIDEFKEKELERENEWWNSLSEKDRNELSEKWSSDISDEIDKQILDELSKQAGDKWESQ